MYIRNCRIKILISKFLSGSNVTSNDGISKKGNIQQMYD